MDAQYDLRVPGARPSPLALDNLPLFGQCKRSLHVSDDFHWRWGFRSTVLIGTFQARGKSTASPQRENWPRLCYRSACARSAGTTRLASADMQRLAWTVLQVGFDWTWMSKSLLNVPTALLCKASFAGAPFDSGSLGGHRSNAARLRPVPDIRAKLRKEYNHLFDRNPGRGRWARGGKSNPEGWNSSPTLEHRLALLDEGALRLARILGVRELDRHASARSGRRRAPASPRWR